TSTGLGDLSELNAIKNVFDGLTVVIGASKSMTGHLLGAAGAIESLISILAIRDGIIPPTINTKKLDEKIPEGLNIVLGKPIKKEINYVLNNTFGFGGHVASTIFKKFER
ncbi:MAG: beta-ketoacyl-[acyl-carrier-protein] synthase II, partial [Pedobacter sp.]